jgi:PHP family Zn ribbon phosphoesterase
MRKPKGTTKVGFVNPHRQVVIRNTGETGTDHNAKLYQIACSRCGHVYGANGTDIFERKCPKCGHGKPGLSL